MIRPILALAVVLAIAWPVFYIVLWIVGSVIYVLGSAILSVM